MSKKKKGAKLLIVLFSLIFLIGAAFFTFRKNVRPVIFTYCDALISSLGMESVNSSAADVVSLYEYSDFIDLEKGSDGKILFLGTNTSTVNGFVRSLALRCENALNAIGRQTVAIPIGAFTGSPLMSNSGPEIKVDITFFSSVVCDFVTSFANVGINQTKHSVYAKIEVLFNTVLPIAEHEIRLSSNILIAENVIIGEIPNVYVSGEEGTNYLDLIP